jgi:hypothetical protein
MIYWFSFVAITPGSPKRYRIESVTPFSVMVTTWQIAGHPFVDKRE